jgi:hypothetical protein
VGTGLLFPLPLLCGFSFLFRAAIELVCRKRCCDEGECH